jgi:hypothetical protein
MPGTIVPNQMYDHECNVLKGWWHPHAIDKSAPVAPGESIAAGSICYLDSQGRFRSGLLDNVVGCFAWPNSGDFDVDGDVGNIQSNVLMGLPTIAAYELWTTEFDADQAYAIGDYLTAWDTQLDGYEAAKKGLVRPGTPYVHTLIGTVTAGVKENTFKKEILSLWTYHLPIAIESGS